MIYSVARPSQIKNVVQRLVRALAGKEAFAVPLVQGIQLRLGMTLLGVVQDDFVKKARGGMGTDGVTWVPLKRETIAQRRLGPGEAKALGITGARTRGLLTPVEDKRWKRVFAQTKAMLMGKFGMTEKEAASRAAATAWAILKREGAKTKLDVLGGRTVEIGRDTGRLFNSLSPGVVVSDNSEQILRIAPGRVIVGSNVKYAATFHNKRPLWVGHPPAGYFRPVLNQVGSGILAAVEQLAKGNS